MFFYGIWNDCICFARITWMTFTAKRLFLSGQLSSCLVEDRKVVKFQSLHRQLKP